MHTAGENLTARLRVRLAGHQAVREKAMFGGRCFMVNEKLLVSAGRDGDLLVRVDPKRSTELLGIEGARIADMGERSMGPSWLLVEADVVASDEGLTFWLDAALAYNRALDAGQARPPQPNN